MNILQLDREARGELILPGEVLGDVYGLAILPLDIGWEVALGVLHLHDDDTGW